MASPSIDKLADLWSLVDQARAAAGIRSQTALLERPANGVTVREYADRYHMGVRSARHQLDHLRQLNSMECVTVMVPGSTGRVIPTNVYVPREEPCGLKKPKRIVKARGTLSRSGVARGAKY